MNMTLSRDRLISLIAGTATAVLVAGLARAEGHVYPIVSEKYKAECGASCHVAYPPQLLGAASWKGIMDGLAKHFGSDASLDGKTAKEITAYLEANAGRGKKTGDGLRITEARWFRHEHGEELSPAIWKHAKVKSAANCEACHLQAAQGDYGERSLRVPR